MIAYGTGRYKDDIFMLIQGTSNLFDGLTDLNTGVKHCSTSTYVHQGFEDTFRSFKNELERFFNKHGKVIGRVHCIGHSLGGALATLAANYLKSRNLEVCLYTFGSPRVGLEQFSRVASSEIGKQNIYRVYHNIDPVPTLPTWPFYHVAFSDLGYRIEMPLSINPVAGHKMANYIRNVTRKNWEYLAANKPPVYNIPELKSWLRIDRPVQLSAQFLELVGRSLAWIFSLSAKATGIALTVAFSGSFTFLDRMAYILSKGAEVLGEAAIWLLFLMKKIGSLIGVRITEGTKLTYDLLKRVFILFHNRTRQFVRHIADTMDAERS